MSEFKNTIDVMGDEAFVDALLQRQLTEFADNVITSVGSGAFAGCTQLTDVNIPNVTTIGGKSFVGCVSLKSVHAPNAVNIGRTMFYPENYNAFSGCSSLESIVLPKAVNLQQGTFSQCSVLRKADFPVLTQIGGQCFCWCNKLLALILRNENKVCTVASDSFIYANYPSSIHKGRGYVLVPRALMEDYKIATNWSVYADQFRAVEDYTTDGTVLGELPAYGVTYDLRGATSEFTEKLAPRYFHTVLRSVSDKPLSNVSITMGGVDVTETVYNNGVVDIPVVTGDVKISATGDTSIPVLEIVPYDGSEEGELPLHRLCVTAGQTVTITYNLTKKNYGCLYEAKDCGLNNVVNKNEANVETTVTLSIPNDGYISFSGADDNDVADGELSPWSDYRLYGKYLRVYVS